MTDTAGLGELSLDDIQRQIDAYVHDHPGGGMKLSEWIAARLKDAAGRSIGKGSDRVQELESALREASTMLRGAAGAIGDGSTMSGMAAALIMKQAADKYDALTDHLKGPTP